MTFSTLEDESQLVASSFGEK